MSALWWFMQGLQPGGCPAMKILRLPHPQMHLFIAEGKILLDTALTTFKGKGKVELIIKIVSRKLWLLNQESLKG